MKCMIVAAALMAMAFPAAAQSPRLYAPDGTYLGNLNSNKFDPDSVSNPYGQYRQPIFPGQHQQPVRPVR